MKTIEQILERIDRHQKSLTELYEQIAVIEKESYTHFQQRLKIYQN